MLRLAPFTFFMSRLLTLPFSVAMTIGFVMVLRHPPLHGTQQLTLHAVFGVGAACTGYASWRMWIARRQLTAICGPIPIASDMTATAQEIFRLALMLCVRSWCARMKYQAGCGSLEG